MKNMVGCLKKKDREGTVILLRTHVYCARMCVCQLGMMAWDRVVLSSCPVSAGVARLLHPGGHCGLPHGAAGRSRLDPLAPQAADLQEQITLGGTMRCVNIHTHTHIHARAQKEADWNIQVAPVILRYSDASVRTRDI